MLSFFAYRNRNNDGNLQKRKIELQIKCGIPLGRFLFLFESAHIAIILKYLENVIKCVQKFGRLNLLLKGLMSL